MLQSLDHVIVLVRDLEAATGTYSRLLGREPSWRGAHPGQGTANTLFRLANTYLELLGISGEGPFAARFQKKLERDGEGVVGLAFGSDDADACAADLRARGLPAADPVEGSGADSRTGAKRSWRNVHLPESATRGVLTFAIEHLSPPDALPPARVTGNHSAAVEGLDHVVLRTADPDATRRFYGESLGLRLALDRSFEERKVRLQFFRVGGVTVEVASQLGAAPDPAVPDRLWGLAWRVPDADAARVRLVEAGFPVTPVRDGHKAGTRVCTVERDTCGVPTLLIAPG
jgi:catechol 2,3-dioxygenase-like lactoylglutathione lyase family enzyme